MAPSTDDGRPISGHHDGPDPGIGRRGGAHRGGQLHRPPHVLHVVHGHVLVRFGAPVLCAAIIEHVSFLSRSPAQSACRWAIRPVMSGMKAVWGAASSVARSWAPLSTPIDCAGIGCRAGLRGRSRCRRPRRRRPGLDAQPLHGARGSCRGRAVPDPRLRARGPGRSRLPSRGTEVGRRGCSGRTRWRDTPVCQPHAAPGAPRERRVSPGRRRWPRSPRRRRQRRRWLGRRPLRRAGRRTRLPWTSPWSRAPACGRRRTDYSPDECPPRPGQHRRPTSTAPSSRTVVPAMSRHASANRPITRRPPPPRACPAAMAGEHVMPRPPGPVTSQTDCSTSSRRQTRPSRHWA